MKRKLVNKIILALSITLMTTTSLTIGKYILLKEQEKSIQIVRQDTNEENKLVSKETLIKKLNNENKMLVLSGEVEIKATYSNKDISDDDVKLQWVRDWFSKMNSKDLIVDATYKYQFYYDLKDLNIDIINDDVNIFLSKNRISCSVELLENKSYYSDRVGLLENSFTPQEINSLNSRTKDLVLNKIQNDEELRNKAITNVMNNIDELLGMKCNYKTTEYDVIGDSNKNILKRN